MYLLDTIKKIIKDGEYLVLVQELLLKLSALEWRKKHRRFKRLYKNKQWEKAIRAGSQILTLESGSPVLFHHLAYCQKKLHNYQMAEVYMKRSLEERGKVGVKDIIALVEQAAFAGKYNISSQYLYLGGAGNLGFIEHKHIQSGQVNKYLTKIVKKDYPYNHFADKECFFHQHICQEYLACQSLSPKMIHAFELEAERLLFMTFEQVSTDPLDKSQLPVFIQINKNLSGWIPAKEVKAILKETDRGKAVALASIMHKESSHDFILWRMKNKIKKMPNRLDLEQLIERIRHIMIDQQLYDKINAKADYVFCHGDYNKDNVLYDQEEKRYYIIDWSSYGLGLPGHDLAKLFISYDFNFQEAKEYYPSQELLFNLFLTYDLLILWIKRLNLDNMEETMKKRLIPGIEYMETKLPFIS